jgi:hypothetical protein
MRREEPEISTTREYQDRKKILLMGATCTTPR